ncbi:MAG: transcription-repair coupling factor, partial [Pseudomonadota bacterium]
MSLPTLTPAERVLPTEQQQQRWGSLLGASCALAVAEVAQRTERPVLLVAEDAARADQLEAELRFFAGDTLPVMHFLEWETLAWDTFSPHQDIISERLRVLSELPTLARGVVIASASALIQRLPPTDYVSARSIRLVTGATLDREAFIDRLVNAGYLRVPQVGEHGEIAVRGSLVDVFPMGSLQPVRIDFFDDEIESLRYFSAETQISGEKLPALEILPAREVPLDDAAIKVFRDRYRERFEGQPSKSRVYRDVSDGIAHGGIEYYLPLFFEQTACLLDFVPDNALLFLPDDLDDALRRDWQDIEERYEMCRLDPERPVLSPGETFHAAETVSAQLDARARIRYSTNALDGKAMNLSTRMAPALRIESRYEDAAAALMTFLGATDLRVLFTSDSAGRREQLFELLSGRHLDLERID